MADIRIKDLATTASVTASDDFMAVDGTTNGTRKLSAATPAFLTSVTTPSLTSPASTNLTLGTGSYGTALTVASATGAATFAGAVTVGKGIVVTDAPVSGLTLEMSHATVPSIRFNKTNSTAQTWQLNGNGSTFGLENVTGNTVPFQISTTGAATFAGAITGTNTGFNSLAGELAIATTKKLYLDGGGDTYIQESSANVLDFYAGAVRSLQLTATTATFAGAVSVATGAAVGGATAGAGGLAFPATAVAVANANTLDDYEEGTWTPTLAPATSGTITVASPNLCGYTKIGRVVTVNGLIEASAVSSPVGATVSMGSLPFQSNADANQRSAGTVRAFSLTTGALNATMVITSSTQTAVLYIDASLFQAASQFYFQLTYTV